MHKVVIGALILAALAGCAGSKMKEARAGSPYKTLASDKATLVVAQCIQFGWQDESVFGVDASAYINSDKAGKQTVYTRGAESFADLQPQGTGTAVSYYAKQPGDAAAMRRLAMLATCL